MIEKILRKYGYKKTKYPTIEEVEDIIQATLKWWDAKNKTKYTYKMISEHHVFVYYGGQFKKSIRITPSFNEFDTPEKLFDCITEGL